MLDRGGSWGRPEGTYSTARHRVYADAYRSPSAAGTGCAKRSANTCSGTATGRRRSCSTSGAFEVVDRRFAKSVEDLVWHRVVKRVQAAVHPRRDDPGAARGRTGITRNRHRRRPSACFSNRFHCSPLRWRGRGMLSSVRQRNRICGSVTLSTYETRGRGCTGRAPLRRNPSAVRLRRQDLQSWWQRINPDLDVGAAKGSLCRRLRDCLPTDSPPQHRLFELYQRDPRQPNPFASALSAGGLAALGLQDGFATGSLCAAAHGAPMVESPWSPMVA